MTVKKHVPPGAEQDFLTVLQKNLNDFHDESLIKRKEKGRRKVTFDKFIHQRSFRKNKSVMEYEKDESDTAESEIYGEETDDQMEISEELSYDEEDMGFDSLSPAEQLRLLMEPVNNGDMDEQKDKEVDEYDGYDDEDHDDDNDEEEVDKCNELNQKDSTHAKTNKENRKGPHKVESYDTFRSKSSSKIHLSLDEEDDNQESSDKKNTKSQFEKQQEKLKKAISELEEENISEKPWMLRGEVTAKNRPMNSLLEHDLDFEHATRTAPVITEEITESIEAIIRQRIKDRAWDDVERKISTTINVAAKRKTLELDMEKSKKSLSEVYEEEYAGSPKSKASDKPIDEATQKAHDEITSLFYKVCKKIDSLSNFKFAPRAYSLGEIEVKILKGINNKHSAK